MTPSPALRTLLTELIDYAGLFPPASLDMPSAVREFAQYRREPEREFLGRFVVPIARLYEFESAAAAHLTPGDPWRLSGLIGQQFEIDLPLVVDFNARYAANGDAPAAIIDMIELRASSHQEILNAARCVPSGVNAFVEVNPDRSGALLLSAVAETSLRAKIRTGGIVPDAIPAPEDVEHFIAACVRQKIPFKATAGLHHPLRATYKLTYEPDSGVATMYGFLNVFLCAALIADGASEDAALGILTEDDIRTIRFGESDVEWRGHRITLESLRRTRASVALSFGSCSFREPIGDLQTLGLL